MNYQEKILTIPLHTYPAAETIASAIELRTDVRTLEIADAIFLRLEAIQSNACVNALDIYDIATEPAELMAFQATVPADVIKLIAAAAAVCIPSQIALPILLIELTIELNPAHIPFANEMSPLLIVSYALLKKLTTELYKSLPKLQMAPINSEPILANIGDTKLSAPHNAFPYAHNPPKISSKLTSQLQSGALNVIGCIARNGFN